jgi:hypothetical protein
MERFLLMLAAQLSAQWDVDVATDAPCSRIRLLNIGRLFEIDLNNVGLTTLLAPKDAMILAIVAEVPVATHVSYLALSDIEALADFVLANAHEPN